MIDINTSAQRLQPGQHLAIGVGGGGRSQVERVGDDSGSHAQRDARVGGDASGPKLPGHQRAGRTDRFVDEPDRLRRFQAAAEAVVVEHLDDLRLIGTADSLPEFIVIDEHDLRLGRINQVRLEREPHQHAVVIHHRKHRLLRAFHNGPRLSDGGPPQHRDKLLIHDRVNELRRLQPQCRVDSVKGADDHRNTANFRQLHQPRR